MDIQVRDVNMVQSSDPWEACRSMFCYTWLCDNFIHLHQHQHVSQNPRGVSTRVSTSREGDVVGLGAACRGRFAMGLYKWPLYINR